MTTRWLDGLVGRRGALVCALLWCCAALGLNAAQPSLAGVPPAAGLSVAKLPAMSASDPGEPPAGSARVGEDPVCRPGTIPVLELAGVEAAVSRQFADLEAELRRLEVAGGIPAATWADAGMTYQAYDFLAASVCSYRAALAQDDGDAVTRYRLAVALADALQVEDALVELDRVLAAGDLYLPALVRRALLQFARGELAAAAEGLAPALAVPEPSVAVLAAAGEIALAEGRSAAAVSLLERALAGEPRATRLHYPLALALRDLGAMERAAGHFARVGRAGVKPADPWLEAVEGRRQGAASALATGHAAWRAGDYAAAREHFARAWESSGRTERGALVNLAAAESALGHHAAALAYFEEAVRLDPGDPTARFNVGALHLHLGRASEAALALAPLAAEGDVDAGVLLAAAELALGRGERALLLLGAVTGEPTAGSCRALADALRAAVLPSGPVAERLAARRTALCPQR